MMMTNKILEYLDFLFPNPVCELTFNTDYQLLMAVVLSAQSTDKRVNSVTPLIFSKYPTLEDLKNAPLDELEMIIRPVGSFRKKASFLKGIAQRLVDEFDGVVPTDREVLESFPGVGHKTANVFLSEYYHVPAIAVDTHVERVSKRLKLAYMKDSVSDVERKLMKKIPKEKWSKFHLQMVLFGRYYCKAIKPSCKDCQLRDFCREKKKNFE